MGNHLIVKKIEFKIIQKYYLQNVYKSFICKQTNCWYWNELFVLCSSTWDHSIVCRQVGSGSLGILPNKYKRNLALSGLQGLICHKAKQTNQTKLKNILSFQKKKNLFSKIWPNQPFPQYLAKYSQILSWKPIP